MSAPASYDGVYPITPDDSHDLSPWAQAISVGTAGNIKITDARGVVSILLGVPAGYVLPVRVRRVWATSTTATNLHGYI